MTKWQFQDFCKENPRNNKEFRHAVEKMIMTEEKMKEIFPNRNNRENNRDNLDRRNFPNMGHPERKRGPANTIAMADNIKKFSKFRRFEDIETMHCIWHPQGNHTKRDCRIFIDQYARKEKNKDKQEDNKKKDEDNIEDKGFQQPKGMVTVIFSRVPGSRRKHQDKVALRSIKAAELVVLRYLNWSQYPIQFSREDQWMSVGNTGLYPLVLDPTIAGMTVTKVLIDGGAGLTLYF
jgi:hypothetical protein